MTDFCYTSRFPRNATVAALVSLLRLAHRYQMVHMQESLLARIMGVVQLEDDSIFAVYAVAIELEITSLIERVRGESSCSAS